jgi:tetratricopeptide (TPR) repeat protein
MNLSSGHFFVCAKRAFALIVSSMLLPLIVLGQGGVGSTRGLPSSSTGIHSIQGKVYFPGAQAGVNKRVRIRLDGSGFTSQSSQTDEDGVFHFNQLQAGPYTITVDGGAAYETAVENVMIERESSDTGRVVKVPIFLKPKPDPSLPPAAVEAYRKGQQADKEGNIKKAIEHFNAALMIHPNFTLALSDLGSLYVKSKDMAKAAETFTTLVKIAPGDVVARLNLGIALFNLKNVAEAGVHLREAVKLNDKLAPAHYYLGLVLVNSRSYPEAEKELELAISNGADNLALAHKYLGGVYMASKKNQQAADELEKYLKLDAKAPDAERIRKTIKDLRNEQ